MNVTNIRYEISQVAQPTYKLLIKKLIISIKQVIEFFLHMLVQKMSQSCAEINTLV